MSDTIEAKMRLISSLFNLGILSNPAFVMEYIEIKSNLKQYDLDSIDDETLSIINEILWGIIRSCLASVEAKYNNYFNRVATYYVNPYVVELSKLKGVANGKSTYTWVTNDGKTINYSVNGEVINNNVVSREENLCRALHAKLIREVPMLSSITLEGKLAVAGIERVESPAIRAFLIDVLRLVERERKIMADLVLKKDISGDDMDNGVKEIDLIESLLSSCSEFLKWKCEAVNDISLFVAGKKR